MTSRKWVRLFLTTLLVGAISTIITGILYGYKEYFHYLEESMYIKLLTEVSFLFILGLVFSAVSQMGFFAYLTVHRFGLGLFKSSQLWNTVQIVLILFALIDLSYVRYIKFGQGNGESFIGYLITPFILLICSIVVAIIKRKETNKGAFIPALFFMIVVTIIEWFPALRVNETSWLILMVVPLFVCNAYQLLILHRTLKS